MSQTFAAAALLAFALGPAPSRAQQVTTLIQFTNAWRYDQSGLELGTAWRTNNFVDAGWPSGLGLLGWEPDTPGVYTIHSPIQTPVLPSTTVTTFYFRTTFNFAGGTNGLSLMATNLVDDGCMIYLNGRPVGGVRAPAIFNATTLFGGPPAEGQLEAVVLTNLHALRQGNNLLAVEVHQSINTSADLMWGMKLVAIQDQPLSITNQPQSQTVIAGNPITLAVGVSGGPAFFRWEKDGAVQSSTSNTLTIASAQPGAAGGYRVIVTNSISAVTSSVAALTVVADTVGPMLLAAIGDNIPAGGGSAFGSNTINLLFSEVVSPTSARNTNHYTVNRLGTTNTVSVLGALYSSALGALLNVDASDPDWTPGGDYVLTVSNVADTRGNVIAPDSRIAVAWGQTTNLIASEVLWDFHASAIFDPDVFDEDWTSCNYAPGIWWAQGQGIFYGGILPDNPCAPLGVLLTQTGYQPEPALYRTTLRWPAHWPSTGTLRIRVVFDDAIVLYLDGKEIYRNNAGAAGSPVGLATRVASAMSLCATNLAIAVSNLQPGLHCLAAAVPQANTPTLADSVFALSMEGLAYLSPALPEPSPPVLSLTPLDAHSARLSWMGGGYALESSTNLSLGSASYPFGPWQPVPNMSNPYTNNLDEPQRFFRLKK